VYQTRSTTNKENINIIPDRHIPDFSEAVGYVVHCVVASFSALMLSIGKAILRVLAKPEMHS